MVGENCLQGLTYYTTPTGVRYAELKSSGNKTGGFDVDRDGILTGVRFFYLPDYFQASGFLEFMLGAKVGKNRPKPVNGPREMFPNSAMYARSGSIEGVGLATGDYELPNYDKGCIATINYETLPFNPQEDEQSGSDPGNPENSSRVSVAIDIAEETVLVGKPGVRWASGNPVTKFTQTPEIRLGAGTITVTRHLVDSFDAKQIQAHLGKINNINLFGYDQFTMLFQSSTFQGTLMSLGNVTAEVKLVFGYRSVKWGYFYNPDKAGIGLEKFEKIVNKNGSTDLYQSSDFAGLIPELGI